eukprot:NODE_328_length_2402_cov_32.945934_g306_i0.p1 GENE.NODE_328_length_2402_cov_32.945934_g306_i0~~NODE_328_length_2402_cov_32.945934_g306_i0.p1  ORF type:complete len:760 (+),score=141.75 NODE_328_length_2402_cov_32.945934_g306_i0:112-2280(+)
MGRLLKQGQSRLAHADLTLSQQKSMVEQLFAWHQQLLPQFQISRARVRHEWRADVGELYLANANLMCGQHQSGVAQYFSWHQQMLPQLHLARARMCQEWFESHKLSTSHLCLKSNQIQLIAEPEFPVTPCDACLQSVLVSLRGFHSSLNSSLHAPVVITAVIDTSGSMGGEPIALVKSTFEFVISQMREYDQLGFITYSNSAQELCPLRCVTTEHRQQLTDAIRSISAGGGTNLAAGLFAGIDQLHTQSASSEVASVWLFTDGLINEGLCDAAQILSEVRARLPSNEDRRPKVFTFGLGTSHDSDLLRKISGSTDGMYTFIQHREDLRQFLSECLGGLLTLIAKKLNVCLRPKPGVSIHKILGARHLSVRWDGPNAQIFFCDLYAEEARDIVCVLQLPPCTTPGDHHVLDVQLTYLSLTPRQPKTQVAELALYRLPHAPPLLGSLHLDAHRNRFAVVDAIEAANNEAVADLSKAAVTLSSAMHQLQASASHAEWMSHQLLNDLQACLAAMQSQQLFHSLGSKLALQMTAAHSHQRACGLPQGQYCTPVMSDLGLTPVVLETLEHRYVVTAAPQKLKLLTELLPPPNSAQTVIFCNSAAALEKIRVALALQEWQLAAVHPGTSVADRLTSLQAFREGRTTLLLATDDTTRATDLQHATLTCNFDFPRNPECYFRRSGRAGAHASGTVLSLITPQELPLIETTTAQFSLSISQLFHEGKQQAVA